MTIKLYDYQEELVNKARQAYKDGYRSPCIVAPCGAGKSVMIAEIIRLATLKKQKVLFLVHRKELLEQIEQTLINHSVDMNYVTLGMVMTVVRRLAQYSHFDLIVVDENHHVLANSYKKILDHFNTNVIGFTATPIRLNGDGLGDINDILIETVDAEWLIQNNRLAPYTCVAPQLIDRKNLKLSSIREFTNASMDKELGKIIYGDVVKHYRKFADGQQAVVYCHSIAFSEVIAKEFSDRGIKASHIDGTTPKAERERIIQQFRDKEITVLTNVDLIGEGFDVPDCSCVILMRPTQSLSLHIQQSMRAMRYQHNKHAIIIDHVGNTLVHGLPDMKRKWELFPPKKSKRDKSEPSYPVKMCDNCLVVYPAKTEKCPACGYEPEIVNHGKEYDRDAELIEIKKEALHQEMLKRKDWRKAKSYRELVEIAKAKGYKSSWAAFKAAELNLSDTPKWVFRYQTKRPQFQNIAAVINQS